MNRRGLRLLVICALLAASALVGVACVPRTTPQAVVTGPSALPAQSRGATREAEALVARYGYHISGGPSRGISVLTTKTEDWAPAVQASYAVGLDLASHSGQSVEFLTYQLVEHSRSHRSPMRAFFIVSSDRVVGAYLWLDGVHGGNIVSLSASSPDDGPIGT